jgi:hypothetical protein
MAEESMIPERVDGCLLLFLSLIVLAPLDGLRAQAVFPDHNGRALQRVTQFDARVHCEPG